MSAIIRDLFNEQCDLLKIDRRFVRDLHDFQTGFVNRNEEHLNYFSSNLLGVYRIKFLESDRVEWFNEIMEVNEQDLKEGLSRVPRDVIDPKWKRANDPMNHSYIWLLYKLHNSTDLSARDKDTAMRDVVLIMQYKFMSSILSHFFTYPADPDSARATYEALSRKFDIKRLGSWKAFFDSRTDAILDSNGIHYPTFSTMRDDAAVVQMFQDIQDRLREVVKKIYSVFVRVREENFKIKSSSSMVMFEEELELVDKTREQSKYRRYIHTVVPDKPTFIRRELLDVMSEVVSTLPDGLLEQALSYMSDNYGRRGDPRVEKLVDLTISHVFDYLSDNQSIGSTRPDLPNLIMKLKNLYMSSRMTNPQLIEMRDLATHIVGRSVKSRNSAVLASVRTAVQVYIVVRAFSMKHYVG